MSIVKVEPGQQIKLSEIAPGDTGDLNDKAEAKQQLKQYVKRLADLQNVLYAEGKHSLLIVLQAMDAGGKDGTIRNILSGVNPQGVRVTSFKAPTDEELAHDFLWRIHKAAPARGMIGVFNRSHYEDVLIVRVHDLIAPDVWRQRYEQINHFEQLLAGNNTTILKFYLHISKQEQKERFQSRLHQPHKRWKFNPADVAERAHWDEYMHAFEDVFQHCSTAHAPWYIVPANRKWYRNVVIAETIVNALESLNLKYPDPVEGIDDIVID
jgi:PPK2 family polyphosphate:nucleotide phosphotransferase